MLRLNRSDIPNIRSQYHQSFEYFPKFVYLICSKQTSFPKVCLGTSLWSIRQDSKIPSRMKIVDMNAQECHEHK